MKRFTFYAILPVMLALFFAGCYEDDGNYTYDESITDITVKLDKVYGVRKQEGIMSITINPDITTVDGEKSHLQYLWEMRTSSETSLKCDTLGTDESVTLEIDTDARDFVYTYYLRLYVTDNQTGGVTVVPTQVQIIKPYTYSWMVLHETDGHAELGAVEYVGEDMVVTPDAYSRETGTSLTGKPRNIITGKMDYLYWANFKMTSQLYVMTDNLDESGIFNHTDKFALLAPWSKLVNATQAGDIDFADLSSASSCNNSGLLVASKGNVFHNLYTSPFFFKTVRASTLVGDCYIDKMAAGPHTAVGYDKVGHRFVHIALQSCEDSWSGFEPAGVYNASPIEPIVKREGDAVNPARISPDTEIINFVNGYHYELSGTAVWQRYQCYAYGLTPDNVSQVYVIRYKSLTDTGGATIIPEMYEFITPAGIDKDTPMASGPKYNNIIFYGTGNKVYKLDVSTGNSTLIYQHEDTQAKVVDLEMAVDGYAWGDSDDVLGEEDYGHPYGRLLGVAINTGDGKGELIVLQLNTAGKVDEDHKFPSTQTHQGFGKITGIAFI